MKPWMEQILEIRAVTLVLALAAFWLVGRYIAFIRRMLVLLIVLAALAWVIFRPAPA